MSDIILDYLTDSPDGKLVTAHAIGPTNIPGTSWSYIGGYSNLWKIYGNKARPWPAINALNTLDAGTPNCHVIADITYPLASFACLAYRCTDANNFFYTICDGTAGINNTLLRIYSMTGGVLTLLSYVGPFTLAAGSYQMDVLLSGTYIQTTFGGQLVKVRSSLRASVTKHGLYSYFSTGVYVDNFQITTLTASEEYDGEDVDVHGGPTTIYVQGIGF